LKKLFAQVSDSRQYFFISIMSNLSLEICFLFFVPPRFIYYLKYWLRQKNPNDYYRLSSVCQRPQYSGDQQSADQN